MWWHTLVIPVLWEAETGGSGFAASLSSLSLSLSLPNEALHNFVRPGFKIKHKNNRAGGVAQRLNTPGFNPQYHKKKGWIY